MNLGLAGKNALVCAASRGIGRASAMALAAEGARVAICARGEDALRRAADGIAAATGNPVVPVRADLSDPADTDELFERIARELGDLQVLVTNAGGPPPSDFLDTTDEAWSAAFGLTFLSAARCVRKALPGMIAGKYGRIVLIASFAVKQPIDHLIQSNAVRSAVTGMAKTLSREVAGHNITVNTVCPGYILTDRLRSLISKRAAESGVTLEDALEAGVGEVPAGRFGTPEEIGAVVAFLASESASYLTGTTIQVDGGLIRGLL